MSNITKSKKANRNKFSDSPIITTDLRIAELNNGLKLLLLPNELKKLMDSTEPTYPVYHLYLKGNEKMTDNVVLECLDSKDFLAALESLEAGEVKQASINTIEYKVPYHLIKGLPVDIMNLMCFKPVKPIGNTHVPISPE